MSDTPRTDEAIDCTSQRVVGCIPTIISTSRQLERELNAANARAEKAEAERDALKAKNQEGGRLAYVLIEALHRMGWDKEERLDAFTDRVLRERTERDALRKALERVSNTNALAPTIDSDVWRRKSADEIIIEGRKIALAALHGTAKQEAKLANGVGRIAAERARQIDKEGWSHEHDDAHGRGQLAAAAKAYVMDYMEGVFGRSHDAPPYCWPWSRDWWKPSADPVRNLEKAGALIAAEIDRLLRAHAALHGTAKQEPKPRTCGECRYWETCSTLPEIQVIHKSDEAPSQCFQPSDDAQKGANT